MAVTIVYSGSLMWLTVPMMFLGWALIWLFRLVCYPLKIDKFSEKFVLITGCDSGFGHDLAIKLAKLGINVFAGCLTEKGEDDLKKEMVGLPGKLVPMSMDVTKDASVTNVKVAIQKELPPGKGLWAIVNNAGISGPTAPDAWLQLSDYLQVMDVNFTGHVRVTHEFHDLVVKEKGRIIFVISILGHMAMNNTGPYSCSKFAIGAFADTLRHELYQSGLKVISICPGYHRTPLTTPTKLCGAFEAKWKQLSAEERQRLGGDAYLKKKLESFSGFLEMSWGRNHMVNVVNAMVHAVTARFPYWRYWIGWDVNLVTRWQAMFPDDLILYVSLVARRLLNDVLD